jgi:hypothetical protein
MANATEIVSAWIDAILKGTVESGAKYLSSKLDWQENGLSYHEAAKRYPRPKWTGISVPGVDLKPKIVARSGQPVVVSFGDISLSRTKIAGDANTVLMEFAVTFKGETSKFFGHFETSSTKIISAHWFGNPDAFGHMVTCTSTAA